MKAKRIVFAIFMVLLVAAILSFAAFWAVFSMHQGPNSISEFFNGKWDFGNFEGTTWVSEDPPMRINVTLDDSICGGEAIVNGKQTGLTFRIIQPGFYFKAYFHEIGGYPYAEQPMEGKFKLRDDKLTLTGISGNDVFDGKYGKIVFRRQETPEE